MLGVGVEATHRLHVHGHTGLTKALNGRSDFNGFFTGTPWKPHSASDQTPAQYRFEFRWSLHHLRRDLSRWRCPINRATEYHFHNQTATRVAVCISGDR